MIYLIGGAPRVGKTTLSKMIMERKGMPFLSTDLLREALDEAYPTLKIKNGEWKEWPDNFFPFLKALIKNTHEIYPDCVIEGDIFFPAHVVALVDKNLKCCYLGTSKTDLATLKKENTHNDWIGDLSPEEQAKLPEWIVTVSEEFKKEAQTYEIPYFDITDDRDTALEKAYTYFFT